ncbi:phosphogluconate dehydratase [Steroidobacter sp. S1-65]|uniref:Phosphogluconate dehydratase n=1 Tax=Steroidobacter gossypii TaxID=2805490 RepID=A0ABS1WU96_9GAMM|nr:phosphogluconate dehydratase [Steroidobacter gossypii]
MKTSAPLHERVRSVTERIRERSHPTRSAYLQRMREARSNKPTRGGLSCTNLAHGFAGMDAQDKDTLRGGRWPNVAIVSSYNDMLSAHRPLERYPELIKLAAREVGAVAQFAGGVPAMCDGVTQGQPGMELSLFSRDVIAMATAVALSHNMFDATLCLGVCDKIVPGLFMGALTFGHLPTIFVPGGPMTSGIPNKEKARIRQLFAEGKVGRDALLESEAQSYHSQGTCTFYGTANSNQVMMEVMGLHLPGAAFVTPNTPLRDALTSAAARRAAKITSLGDEYLPMCDTVDERAIVNAMVGLLATGGSTNHTLHLVAMARVAGININWDDFSDLSEIVPLLARIYPNGAADVNHFHAAGGMGFLIRQLIGSGLLHQDTVTVVGQGLDAYTREPWLSPDGLRWRPAPEQSGDPEVLRPITDPFGADGGLKVLRGNLGRGVIKTSAVQPQHRVVEAPARVFNDQEDVIKAFKAGELSRDCVVVVRYQGPRANGMPELHQLTPTLTSLQSKGFKVALVTDGRMSGASGAIPAAIHVTPECLNGGPLEKVQDGDVIRLDSYTGMLEVRVPDAVLRARSVPKPDLSRNAFGVGRELFATFRAAAGDAEAGAASIFGGT